jgi:hypothetical protein
MSKSDRDLPTVNPANCRKARSQNGLKVVLRAEADVGAQRAVFGLLADVKRHQRPDAVVDIVGDVARKSRLAVLDRVGTGRDAAVARVVLGLDAEIAAQLQASVGAGNVIEAVAVEAADLHVLHRRCLHRPSYVCSQ